MRNKKIFASLALFPIILSGCASNGAGDTPFFASGDKTVTATAIAPPSAVGDTENSETINPNKKESKQPSESEKNQSTKTPNSGDSKSKNTDSVGDGNSSENSNEKNNPNVDSIDNSSKESDISDNIITSVTRPKDSVDIAEEENRLKASPEQQKAGIEIANAMVEKAKAGEWKSACKFVYLTEMQKTSDCIDKMKRSYTNGVNFTKFTNDNIASLSLDKDALSISLKGKAYEESQRTAFINEDGVWKVLFM